MTAGPTHLVDVDVDVERKQAQAIASLPDSITHYYAYSNEDFTVISLRLPVPWISERKLYSAHVTTSRTSAPVPNFISMSLRGAFPQICEILRFRDFFVVLSCPVLVILFFLATPPRSNPWTEFNHLRLKWRVVAQGYAFWGGLNDHPQY